LTNQREGFVMFTCAKILNIFKKLINNSGAKHKEKSQACRGFICDKKSC
jgi:hypothetical protein